MDVSPKQLVSIAAALIRSWSTTSEPRPDGRQHAEAGRAAAPVRGALVGTGVEYRAAVDAGDVVIANENGTVEDVSADQIVTKDSKGALHVYELIVPPLQPGHERPRSRSSRSATRSRRARSSPTAPRPRPARSRSARTWSSPTCPGRATTTRTRSSCPSARKEDVSRRSTSSTRSTPATRSWAPRRSPATSPTSARRSSRTSTSADRASGRGQPRRLPRGQGHPKGRDRAHARGAPAPRDLR